jgi:probable HAF family extracellular repeat protein
MQTPFRHSVWCCALLCLTATVHAAEIRPLGALALGVSGDGSVVVGGFESPTELSVFRWDDVGGMQILGQGVAYDVSLDGSVLVGERILGAFRWTSEQGFTNLGSLPGGNGSANAYDVSGDGSVVVGLSHQSTGFHGFRWTAASGMTALGDLPGGFNFSQADSISADGQITVGASTAAAGDRAVRWVGSNPTPIDMGLPPGRSGFTEANGISRDGTVIVGVWGTGLANEAFRWTEGGGYVLLGDLPGGIVDSVGYATNADGSVIVGTGNPGDDVPDEAFYWTESSGMRSLRAVLTEGGADVSAWQTLDLPTGLSDDGTVIVGNGMLVDGTFAGFRAVIPEPSGLALAIFGFVAAGFAIARHLSHRRTAATGCVASAPAVE